MAVWNLFLYCWIYYLWILGWVGRIYVVVNEENGNCVLTCESHLFMWLQFDTTLFMISYDILMSDQSFLRKEFLTLLSVWGINDIYQKRWSKWKCLFHVILQYLSGISLGFGVCYAQTNTLCFRLIFFLKFYFPVHWILYMSILTKWKYQSSPGRCAVCCSLRFMRSP